VCSSDLASVARCGACAWDVEINCKSLSGIEYSYQQWAMDAAEVHVREWFTKISPWPIEFDRSEL
jgi:hypothetical protein